MEMQFEVIRRGGIAGVTARAEVDTANMTSNRANRVEAALRELPYDRPPSPPPHPDSFQYEITTIESGGRRTATLDESEVPAQLLSVLRSALGKGELD
jgi:Emfourin